MDPTSTDPPTTKLPTAIISGLPSTATDTTPPPPATNQPASKPGPSPTPRPFSFVRHPLSPRHSPRISSSFSSFPHPPNPRCLARRLGFLFSLSLPPFSLSLSPNTDRSTSDSLFILSRYDDDMARRPPASGGNVLPQSTRQNEYFVPRDGIDREVITADICRYLGNDALVRPGNYEACRATVSPNGCSLRVFILTSSLCRTPRMARSFRVISSTHTVI